MTADDDQPTPGAFTEVILRRNTVLPDGSTHGSEGAFSIAADPVSGDLLHALSAMVDRLDKATARGIAEAHGTEAGLAYLDRVAEATARWTEDG